MKRVATFLVLVALVAAVVGCPPSPVTQYELTISNTQGGSVMVPGEGASAYDEGTVVSLLAEAEEGYRFVNWTGDAGSIASVSAASTTITMNGDYSITANFVGVCNLTIASTAGGAVTAPGEGTFAYDLGATVNLVATPDTGYRLVSWTGDADTVADTNAAETTITMNDHYSITASFEQEEAVVFADPNLEAAIREAIGILERLIYPSDLEGLTYLDASGRNIIELTGLEYCTDLTDLNLQGNQISDISPLANLTSLMSLLLAGNQISDTELLHLASLTNLRKLSLGSNQISDISPLANLTSLTELYLGGTQLDDTGLLHLVDFIIANFTNLTLLELSHNQISGISPLANLTQLTWLSLYSNQISDISPLASLTSLTWLDLRYNQISDISPLANLTNLTALSLSGHRISDISLVVDLTNLTRLCLDDSQISDISALANLTSLTSLSLRDNEISDISPLANLTSLTQLWLWENQISDIAPLANLTYLTWLFLGNNQLCDISPLASLTSLTWLRLPDNQIRDIDPLVQNEGLGTGDVISLSGNPLDSDSVTVYIPELEARGVTVYYG